MKWVLPVPMDRKYWKILGIVQPQRAAASWHPTIRWVDIIAIGQATSLLS